MILEAGCPTVAMDLAHSLIQELENQEIEMSRRVRLYGLEMLGIWLRASGGGSVT